MRKLWALLLCLLLFSLSAASLELDSEEGVAESVGLSVRRALERSMLPLLKEDEILVARLDASLALELRVDDRHLTLNIPAHTKDVEDYLVSNLSYDGLVLLQELPALRLEFSHDRGFAAGSALVEGRPYLVLDGQGNTRGVVVASHVRRQEPVLAFLQQTSGKELLVGMGLEPMGLFPLSVDMYLQGDGSMGLGVGTSYPLGSYPFRLHFGFASPDLQQGYLVAGLGAALPFSHLFSPNNHLVRSLSLEGKALFGVGTSFSEGGLYYAAEGSISLVYQRGAWSFRVGGGNHVSASAGTLKRQGLFLNLGTAYTYTL